MTRPWCAASLRKNLCDTLPLNRPNYVKLLVTGVVMWAVSTENVEAAKLLLNAGAKVDAKSDDGLTAMDIAQRQGNLALVGILGDAQKR